MIGQAPRVSFYGRLSVLLIYRYIETPTLGETSGNTDGLPGRQWPGLASP